MITRRRLLNFLASHTRSSSAASAAAATSKTVSSPTTPAGPLLPPYSHKAAVSEPSLRPPYNHAVRSREATDTPNRLRPRQRFSLTPASRESVLSGSGNGFDDRTSALAAAHKWRTWAEAKMASPIGREEIQTAWNKVLNSLRVESQTSNQIPEIASHNLASELSSPSTLQAIQNAGILIVRDVIPDAEAITWARDVLEDSIDRSSPLYWHRALIEARSHPSLISTNDRLVSALRHNGQREEVECYILSEGVQANILVSGTTNTLDSIVHGNQGAWTVSDQSPISAHLCLTPLLESASSAVQTSSIHPSVHSITYKSLRPLFKALNSKISFYQSQTTNYLHPSNWTLLDKIPTTEAISAATLDLPHLSDGFVHLPNLNPGDVIYRHPAIPVLHSTSVIPSGTLSGTEETEQEIQTQLFLPVSPLLPSASNLQFIEHQKRAFEQGSPPPSARFEGETVTLEDKGKKDMIRSHGGRRAMGY